MLRLSRINPLVISDTSEGLGTPEDRYGSFATGANLQQGKPRPECPENGSFQSAGGSTGPLMRRSVRREWAFIFFLNSYVRKSKTCLGSLPDDPADDAHVAPGERECVQFRMVAGPRLETSAEAALMKLPDEIAVRV